MTGQSANQGRSKHPLPAPEGCAKRLWPVEFPCRSPTAFPKHRCVTPAADGRHGPGTATSSRQPTATARPPPSTTGRKPDTQPDHHAASRPPAAEYAEASATASTYTGPSRTPPPPPSTTEADHHTPGSTAGPPRQTPQPRSSSRTHLTARVQKHALSLFFIYGLHAEPPECRNSCPVCQPWRGSCNPAGSMATALRPSRGRSMTSWSSGERYARSWITLVRSAATTRRYVTECFKSRPVSPSRCAGRPASRARSHPQRGAHSLGRAPSTKRLTLRKSIAAGTP
ncbi:hypothetical protein SFUMM280S_04554 [Streptomyces fumanus]